MGAAAQVAALPLQAGERLMAEEDERHPLFVSPDECEIGSIIGGNVGLRVRTAEVEALLPALDLVIRLSPSEARALADKLQRWADRVEDEPSRTP